METLSPRVRFQWAATTGAGVVVLGALVFVIDRFVVPLWPLLAVAVVGLLLPVVVWYVVALYRGWRFEVQEDALYLERGVFTRVETAVPYVRVQHVDTQRGPLERALGLASVVVYTAGSRGADVTVPGLSPDRARSLRNQLRDLAIESEPDDAV